MAMTKSMICLVSLAFACLLCRGVSLARTSYAKASAPLVVDNFEEQNRVALFSPVWVAYTDEAAGGKSTAEANFIDGGANNTKRALRLSGKITTDFQFGGFAGVATQFVNASQSKDLTAFTGISFYARGDGRKYQVHALSAAVKDHNEFAKEFVAPKEWTLVKVPLSQLAQAPFWGRQVTWTGKDVRGVAFQTAMEAPSAFALEVDEISFY